MKKKIKVPSHVASWSDGYWSDINDYLRDEGHIGQNEFPQEMVLTVSVEENVEVTVIETVEKN